MQQLKVLYYYGALTVISALTVVFWNDMAPYVGSVIVLLINLLLLPWNIFVYACNALVCLTSGNEACHWYIVWTGM